MPGTTMPQGPPPGYPTDGSYGTPPPIIFPPSPIPTLPAEEQTKQIQRLSARLEEHPEETQVAFRLAQLLENEASMRGQLAMRDGASDGKSAAHPSLSQALEIYQRLGTRPAPYLQRAEALVAAAAVSGRLEDAQQEYRFLLQAAAVNPFEAPIWYKLHQAALRSGDLVESRKARVEVERWRFPDLQPG